MSEAVVRPSRDDVKMKMRNHLPRDRSIVLFKIKPRRLQRVRDGVCDRLRCDNEFLERIWVSVVKSIRMFLWHDERVSRIRWLDVEKCNDVVILVHGRGWNFFRDDFTEEAVGHTSSR